MGFVKGAADIRFIGGGWEQDGIMLGAKGGYIECKAGRDRLPFDAWRPEQREWAKWVREERGAEYWLYVTVGDDAVNADRTSYNKSEISRKVILFCQENAIVRPDKKNMTGNEWAEFARKIGLRSASIAACLNKPKRTFLVPYWSWLAVEAAFEGRDSLPYANLDVPELTGFELQWDKLYETWKPGPSHPFHQTYIASEHTHAGTSRQRP
jgi:hypothetical protein